MDTTASPPPSELAALCAEAAAAEAAVGASLQVQKRQALAARRAQRGVSPRQQAAAQRAEQDVADHRVETMADLDELDAAAGLRAPHRQPRDLSSTACLCCVGAAALFAALPLALALRTGAGATYDALLVGAGGAAALAAAWAAFKLRQRAVDRMGAVFCGALVLAVFTCLEVVVVVGDCGARAAQATRLCNGTRCDGEVRAGRVEVMRAGGRWGGVCFAGAGEAGDGGGRERGLAERGAAMAAVVCAELGFRGGEVVGAREIAQLVATSRATFLGGTVCLGCERDLSGCLATYSEPDVRPAYGGAAATELVTVGEACIEGDVLAVVRCCPSDAAATACANVPTPVDVCGVVEAVCSDEEHFWTLMLGFVLACLLGALVACCCRANAAIIPPKQRDEDGNAIELQRP